MSTFRSCIFAISLILIGCGGGDDGDGGNQPDAASPGTPDAGTPPGVSQCESYCSAIMANCSDVTVYTDVAVCMASCEKLLPEGSDPGADEHSVQCRTRYALEAASGDKATACAAADLHGNDTCGSWCEVYCDLMELNCSDQPSNYASRGSCLEACAGFATSGDPALDSGDTVQCRIHHAGVPAMRNPEDACGHAAQSSSNYCIDEVDVGF